MVKNSTVDITGIPASNAEKLNVIDLSVCIVTYQARDWLEGCLKSLYENTRTSNLEVIVADNGSTDGIEDMLTRDFPEIHFIGNSTNEGYTRPMNQSLHTAQGRYLLQLNPDTVILREALDRLISFMDDNPQIGICSPKVLNRDGTFQRQSRRGEPRPLAMIGYFFKLSKLFPKNKALGEYLLEYKDENKTAEVIAVSGSCMLIRKEVIDQVGYLDEQFFAYQEDTDFCLRARQAGWEVYYYPEAEIIHYGGRGGSRVEPYRSIIEWHRSYWRLYKKHLAKDYIFIFNWFYYLFMVAKLVVSLVANLFRRDRYAGPKR
jgi:GT2 family glycosyltransferase